MNDLNFPLLLKDERFIKLKYSLLVMKVYIAARFNKKQEVRHLYSKFKKLGHEIAADWTLHKLIKPYENNVKIAREYSVEDINAVRNCDVFILLSDEAGTGMYVELGAAISSNLEHGKPKIYVVGDHISRSMFYFHPSVNRRKTIDEVLEEIKEL